MGKPSARTLEEEIRRITRKVCVGGDAFAIRAIDPMLVTPWNDSYDTRKTARIAESMNEVGWQGRPLVVVPRASGGYQALTGSHRIEAAREVGIPIQAICVTLPLGWTTKMGRSGIFRHGHLIDDAEEAADLLEQDSLPSQVVRLLRAM